ncbi:MAG: hypothetical protein QOF44_4713 [Streptomyces sp.]|nr:hypothetical protein [Streptomyces sp.]
MGVDACPLGWVAVILLDGRFAGAEVASGLAELLERVPYAEVVGIDIPLGLLETGRRRAEALAAGKLGPHRSRVFPVPPRAVWEQADYDAANLHCREITGAGLSRQTWGLARKLREANQCRELADSPLHEVHPEVSFAAMNEGTPIAAGKKSWNGQAERRRLLRAQGIVLPEDLGAAGRVPPDDLLDAAAAAWSARRIALGTAVSLPAPPEVTSTGLPIAIWY